MSDRIIKVAVLQEKAMPRSTVQEKLERTLTLIKEASEAGAQIILGCELCTIDYDRCYGEKDNDLFSEADPIPGPCTETGTKCSFSAPLWKSEVKQKTLRVISEKRKKQEKKHEKKQNFAERA